MPKRRKRRQTRIACTQTPEGELLDVDQLDELQLAVLKLMMVRFRDFVARFGHEPDEEEPLFFDVKSNRPVKASPAEVRGQIVEAAQLPGADVRLLLRFFGFDEPASHLH